MSALVHASMSLGASMNARGVDISRPGTCARDGRARWRGTNTDDWGARRWAPDRGGGGGSARRVRDAREVRGGCAGMDWWRDILRAGCARVWARAVGACAVRRRGWAQRVEGFRSWRARASGVGGRISIALRVCGGCSCVAFACTDDVCLCFIGVSLTFGVEQEQGKWTMIRHGKKNPKLNRPADQRKALIRGLTTELLRHGTVTTTMARAKAIRKPVENMIQLAKDGDDYKRRMAESFIYDKEVVNALFEQAPTRYADRNGGYTRIVRTLSRRGDNATMGVIRLV